MKAKAGEPEFCPSGLQGVVSIQSGAADLQPRQELSTGTCQTLEISPLYHTSARPERLGSSDMMFISTPIRRLPPACCARAVGGGRSEPDRELEGGRSTVRANTEEVSVG